MKWEMLTAIGQLATVCIGVPSIIYFAIQLREQNRERRQSAVNALTEQWGELTKALHENGEFTAIYLRGVQSFHDLDAVSKLRFSAFQNRFFKNFEGMYYSRRERILSTELWDEIDRTISSPTKESRNGGRHAGTGTPKRLLVSLTALSRRVTSRRHIRPMT